MKLNRNHISLALGTAAVLATMPAQAYVGPGAGITLIGALIGLLSAVFLALWAVLRWPFRRLMARRKAAREARDGTGKPSEPGQQ